MYILFTTCADKNHRQKKKIFIIIKNKYSKTSQVEACLKIDFFKCFFNRPKNFKTTQKQSLFQSQRATVYE